MVSDKGIELQVHIIKELQEIDCDIAKLAEIYSEVFAAPPRNEKIDKIKIREEIKNEINNGFLFIAKDSNGEIQGFATCVKTDKIKSEDLKEFKDIDGNFCQESYYFSTIALKDSFRSKGIGNSIDRI